MIRKIKTNQKGAIAILTLMGVSIFALTIMITLSTIGLSEIRMSSAEAASETTFYSAEAGINEALYRLISTAVPEPFSLEMEGYSIEVTVGTVEGEPYQRLITSSATDQTGKVRTIQIIANTTAFASGFKYAVQAGQGGLEALNNSEVIGDIYSNGNIFGGTGAAIQASVQGNTWVARGQPISDGPAQEVTDNEFSVANTAGNTDVAQSFSVSEDIPLKKVSLYLKKVGNLNNNVLLKIINDNGAGSPGTDIVVEKEIKKNDLPTNLEWLNVEFDIGPILLGNTTYWLVLDSPSFNPTRYLVWGLNTDGNSYSEGVAKKSENYEGGNWTPIAGDFAFKTSLGVGDTFVRKMEINGDIHAHTIENSEIEEDAYYQNIIEPTTIGGTSYPGSNDPEPKPYPIKDSHIAQWKAGVSANEINGDYNVVGTETLGNVKINGNLTLGGGAHLTLSGNVWVTGDVVFIQPNAEVALDSSFGENNGVIIADGRIDVNNNTTINGSGDPLSYLLILSTNNSIDPDHPAINVANNSEAVVFYAKNGMVRIYNGSELNGVTGYYVRLEEQSAITYSPALQSFPIPNGGGEEVGTQFGSWHEI